MKSNEVKPEDFLIALNHAKIRWLLIGRRALIHYGAPLQTLDFDLWVDPARGNLQSLLDIAIQLGLESPGNVEEVAEKPMFSLFADTLKVDVFKVKVFINLDGERIRFKNAYENRTKKKAAGDPLDLPLPALEDLRRLKRMRESEKDREDLKYIDAIREDEKEG